MKRRFLVPLVVVCVCVGAFLLAALLVRRESRRCAEIDCCNNLECIGLGIQNYYDVNQRYPSPDADGHSWRIRIVPFLFASSMYSEYRFDEPWDSESNLTLDSRPLPVKGGGPDEPHGMPFAYKCSQISGSPSMAAYLMFVGEDAFGNPGGYRQMGEITDSLECTLVVAETIPNKIHWLDPTDFNIETMSFKINDPNALSISSNHSHGPAVLFADGEVFRMSPRIDAKTLQALITINGGEELYRDDLIDDGLLTRYSTD